MRNWYFSGILGPPGKGFTPQFVREHTLLCSRLHNCSRFSRHQTLLAAETDQVLAFLSFSSYLPCNPMPTTKSTSMQRLDLTPCKLLHLNMECYKYIILPVILPNKSFKEQTNLKRKHTKKSFKKKKKKM